VVNYVREKKSSWVKSSEKISSTILTSKNCFGLTINTRLSTTTSNHLSNFQKKNTKTSLFYFLISEHTNKFQNVLLSFRRTYWSSFCDKKRRSSLTGWKVGPHLLSIISHLLRNEIKIHFIFIHKECSRERMV